MKRTHTNAIYFIGRSKFRVNYFPSIAQVVLFDKYTAENTSFLWFLID
jgi:hypothetical protein